MPVELERDLGLYATLTVSIGAMIGSGIFVLPGLGFKISGPSIVAAYLLAGLIVLPAALSKAEMATAMPQAGGTYLYIDRAMGPLFGTIAGIGAWFSLTFKSAFALVGLGAYLAVFSTLPAVPVAVALALLLVVVNVVGVKQTGRFQAVVVTLVLISLVVFIGDGLTYVQGSRFHPFFGTGEGSLLAATGFVFVSYAGVTKIASVAEEVERPGRNIPIGILGSVVLMMLVYTLTVFVVVGVTPAAVLRGSTTPMALAAEVFLGEGLAAVVAAVAVLALVSMANAGVLSSSRFPFAMSRDALAPPQLGYVQDQFQTPVVAIGLTGAVLLALIVFVPVFELAKLASAFKILVFSFINVALITFRESELESYDPEFVAPGYPWVQLFGLGAGLVLLTQMGALPFLGAVGIIVGGIGWYRLYGRERTDREGAALDAIRRSTKQSSVASVEGQLADTERRVLVALEPDTDPDRAEMLVTIADNVAKYAGSPLHVVRFREVPDQVPLSSAAEQTPDDEVFEREMAALTDDLDAPVEIEEVVSHDPAHSVGSYVASHDIDLVVGEWVPDHFHGELLGRDVDWYMGDIQADFLFVRDRGVESASTVAVVTNGGPYDPLEVVAADAVALEHDLTVRLLYGVASDASDEYIRSIRDYHDSLTDQCFAAVESEVVLTDDPVADLARAAGNADVVVTRTEAHTLLYDVVVGTVTEEIADRLDSTVVLTHTDAPRRHSFLRSVLERFAF